MKETPPPPQPNRAEAMEKSEENEMMFSSQLPDKVGTCEEQLMLNIAKAKAVSHFCGYSFHVRKTYAGYFIFRK